MHNRWHPDLRPIAEVEPGQEIRLETEEGLGGQFTRESTHEDVANCDRGLGHPLSGPIYVKGAEPGQVLEVELLAYESDDFGTTAVIPGFGFLADLFPDPYLVKWEIASGVARSEELPGVAIPEELFAGDPPSDMRCVWQVLLLTDRLPDRPPNAMLRTKTGSAIGVHLVTLRNFLWGRREMRELLHSTSAATI